MKNKKLLPSDVIEARVFALIPTQSNKAIIICRLRAKQVGVFQWDITTNKITIAQWLKGRIYEYLSDISPDGNHFIYSANHKREGYTAISKAPWIKAISFWRNVGGWGGGIFIDNKSYMLFDGYDSYSKFIDKSLNGINRRLLINGELPFNIKLNEFKIFGIYSARLIEQNWITIERSNNKTIFHKIINNNLILEKIFYKGCNKKNSKGVGIFCETHNIIKNNSIIDKVDWEWCEYSNNKIFYIKKGCLYELKDINDIPKLIYNFNNEKFINKIAPY